MVMGEDVGKLGGVFRATAGLQERFGVDRCVDTPLAEAGILGTAVGLCMAGWRPVVEMQYDAFSYPALDQLINHVGRYRWRTRGAMSFPLTIRMPYGGGVRAPELHDDSPETYYVHTPGVKVAIPSTSGGREGPARCGDPRSGSGRRPRAEAPLPHLQGGRSRGRARRSARRVADRARGLRSHDRRVRGDGARRARGCRRPRGRGVVRGARPALAQAARRGRPARVGRARRGASSSCRRRRAYAASPPRSRPCSRRRRSSTCGGRWCA